MDVVKCCFCGARCPELHNPAPVNSCSDAYCCTRCNNTIVIPARMAAAEHPKKNVRYVSLSKLLGE